MKIKFLFILFTLFTYLLNAQQPQWITPIYFKDGNGDKDTLWIGYDPNATDDIMNLDTNFGENWITVDTSKFNVGFASYPHPYTQIYPGMPTNKILKTNITSLSALFFFSPIYFIHGNLPITIKWENADLYDPSLPFQDIYPRPRARFEIECSSNCFQHCPYDALIILTDYPTNDPCWSLSTILGDSVYFENCYGTPIEPFYVIDPLIFRVVPHDAPACLSINVINKSNDIVIKPNPFIDTIEIIGNNIDHRYSIYNIYGVIVEQGLLKRKSINYINLCKLKRGMYVFQFDEIESNAQRILIKLY